VQERNFLLRGVDVDVYVRAWELRRAKKVRGVFLMKDERNERSEPKEYELSGIILLVE